MGPAVPRAEAHPGPRQVRRTRCSRPSRPGRPASLQQELQAIDGVAQLEHVGARRHVEHGITCPERGTCPAGGSQEIGAVSILEGRRERLEERDPAFVTMVAKSGDRQAHPAGDVQGGFVELRILPAGRSRVATPPAGCPVSSAHARPVGGGKGGTTPLPCAPVLRSSVSVMRFRSEPPMRARSE